MSANYRFKWGRGSGDIESAVQVTFAKNRNTAWILIKYMTTDNKLISQVGRNKLIN
jgi:hypothetical protein